MQRLYVNSAHQRVRFREEKDIRESAGKALNLIIHDYSRFRVETIDSFFQSVMRNLSRELELGANMTIELDNTTALSEAVDSMIEKLNRNSPVLYWLLDYIEERIQEDKQWIVANEIKDFGKNIFNEEYENNGYAGSGYYIDDNGKSQIYRYAGYAAQAPIHIMGNISLKF